MNLKDDKTSGELKNEVLNELQNVRRDLDLLQRRITPGQIIDDALFRPVGRTPRMIFDHLKANPIGTAFLSLGTILLMENDSHVTYESSLRTRGASVINKTRSDVKAVRTKVDQAVDKTRSKIEEIKQKMTPGNIPRAEFQFNEGGELGHSSFEDTVQDFKTGIQENLGEIKDSAFAKVAEVAEIKELDAMAVMAMGAGLGALTGVSLPVSAKEDELIDQKLSGTLSEFSSEFQEAINQSVKILKNELLGKFTNFDVNLFKSNPEQTQTQRSA